MSGYKKIFKNKKFPESEIKSKGIFSLPIYPNLKIEEVKLICKKLKHILINLR